MSTRASGCLPSVSATIQPAWTVFPSPTSSASRSRLDPRCNRERWGELVRQNSRAGWAHVQPADVNSGGKAVHVGPPATKAHYSQAAFRLERVQPVER